MQKYHFFYNKAAIRFIISEDFFPSPSEAVGSLRYQGAGSIADAVSGWLGNQQSFDIYMGEDQRKKAFSELCSHFRVEYAAGGIVRNAGGDFLVIRRFGFCDFPKGHVEPGENNLQAALREVSEETGIPEAVVERELPKTYHVFRSNGGYVLKSTQWYAMHSAYTGELRAQAEEQITDARWVPKERMLFLYASFFPSLQLLLDESGLLV
ncbi:MAG: NUDIX domain-containing protein [Bacteroidales bacterium]|nr:NUDIX domain-containing protein [Bacteroidales bacterium]